MLPKAKKPDHFACKMGLHISYVINIHSFNFKFINDLHPHFKRLANYESPIGKKTHTHTNVEITFFDTFSEFSKANETYYKIEVVNY
jgi:hypothetical protein